MEYREKYLDLVSVRSEVVGSGLGESYIPGSTVITMFGFKIEAADARKGSFAISGTAVCLATDFVPSSSAPPLPTSWHSRPKFHITGVSDLCYIYRGVHRVFQE